MSALAAEQVPQRSEHVTVAEVDWMADLVWCRARRTQLLERLFSMGATPAHKPIDRELYNARVDALRIFDQRIAELEGARV